MSKIDASDKMRDSVGLYYLTKCQIYDRQNVAVQESVIWLEI